jgi:hypothetical protein
MGELAYRKDTNSACSHLLVLPNLSFSNLRGIKSLEAESRIAAQAYAGPTPFVWTASVERILEKIARARKRLEQIAPGCTQPKRRAHGQRYAELTVGHYTSSPATACAPDL